jgi:hypothetical protein
LNPIATPVAPHADDHAKRRKRRRLGKHLVKQGIVPKSAVRSALEEQERTGHRLGEILIARGALDPVTLVKALADQDLVETVSSSDRVAQALPISVAFEHRAVVLIDDTDAASRVTRVAVTDLATVPAIWEALGRPIEPKLTDPDTMERLLSQAYPDARDVADSDVPATDEDAADTIAADDATVETAPIDDDVSPPVVEAGSEMADQAPIAVAPIEVAADQHVAEPAADAARTQADGLRTDQALPATPTSTSADDAAPSPIAEPAWAPPVAPTGASDAPAVTQVAPAPRRGGLRRLVGRQPVPAMPPIRTVAPAEASRNGTSPSGDISGKAPDTAVVEPELPVATVIVGLRQVSPATLGRLVTSIEAIDYPRDRLQILAVHDPADRVTRRALHDQPLPIWVTETVVPRTGTPGPRGLLLSGLREARGELVTVLSLSQPLEATLLRAVATAKDASALASAEALGSRSLTDAFLRQAEPHGLERVAPTDPAAATPMAVFRVAELRAAFGWPSSVAVG